MDPVIVNVPAKFEVRSFTLSWDNSDPIGVLGGGLRTPTLGKGTHIGGLGWYRSKERW